VGTAARVRAWIDEELEKRGARASYSVASNPEFLREGAAIEDALEPIRVVIGAPNNEAARSLIEIYAPFEAPMIVTSPQAAELCKYACNVFLATKLSFVNLVAMLCDKAGADIKEVTRGMGCDPRIGHRFLSAGLGFGGSCFPKDVSAFANTLRDHGCPDALVQATLDINKGMPQLLVDKIAERVGDLNGRRFAFWGLAFKPQSDDMRQAKSLELARSLLNAGAEVCAHDPQAMANAQKMLPEIEYCDDIYETCNGADGAVLVTEWPEYQHLDLQRVAGLLRMPLLFDGRNYLDPEAVQLAGLEYRGLGRPYEG
jgi:UDPglucose 6-dehydrogenase